MSGIVIPRIRGIVSVLVRKETVRQVGVVEGVLSAFRWYGIHRRVLRRLLRVTELDAQLSWVDVGEFGIAWPRAYPLSRLIGALIELRAPSNSHFYFSRPTVLRRGATVVDVGASEGAFAVECLVTYGAAHVWCFEPESSMIGALTTTAERNGLADKLHIVPAAATRTSRKIGIVENPSDPLAAYCLEDVALRQTDSSPRNVREIDGIALDDWVDRTNVPRVDFLKIDSEGSDLSVLEGARALLVRWRPAIAVTTYHHPDHCNAMIEYLRSLNLGYRYRVRGVIEFDGLPRPVMLHAAPGGETPAGE